MSDFDYTTYPEGYNKLIKKLIPFFLRKMMEPLFLQILTDD